MTALHDAVRACALTLAATALLAGCAGSSNDVTLGGGGAEPPQMPRYQESFEGGSTPFANPAVNLPPIAACPSQASGSPLCIYHRITPPPTVKNVLVAISPGADAEAEGDDYDMAIYDDKGVLVGASASGGAHESTVFATNGSAYYEIRVQPYTVTSTDSTYTGVATAVDTPIDNEPKCDVGALSGEEYPEYVSVTGVTDDGHEIDLSVAVLLDGVSEDLARRVMARAADVYSQVNIKLSIAGVQALPITATTSDGIIAEAKEKTAYTPPFNADIAAVFTSKGMQAATGGAGTVLGQADCIGGIRAPANSYLAATIEEEDAFPLAGGFFINGERGPETMAHEIAHLMGAHHHYGNCVEGLQASADRPMDLAPCTLMFPSVEPIALIFGQLEGITVRGHAVDFAETR